MRDRHGKPRPHRTAVEQRGVSDTDVFTNEQLATTLDELIKVYGKAQGEAFFRLGRTRHQRIRVVAMGRLPIILRNAPCVSRCGMPCGRPLCGLLWVIARRGKRPRLLQKASPLGRLRWSIRPLVSGPFKKSETAQASSVAVLESARLARLQSR